MLRLDRKRVVSALLVSQAAGMLGCPQLLDDSFDTVRIVADAGPLGGLGQAGRGGLGGFGGAPSAGTGGSSASAGTGGSAGTAGSGGTIGLGGTGGTGGTNLAGTGGAGATGGEGAGGGSGGGSPTCWTFELTTDAAGGDSNCAGVDGWNEIAVDTASSSVLQSYQGGQVCFEGTIAAIGWGATYNFALAGDGEPDDGETWNATEQGVTGFELTTSGAALPAFFTVTYSINRDSIGFTDYCQNIGTGPALVPFAGATRENCGGGSTGALADVTALEFLRLSFPVTGSAYPVDFCLQLRAF